MKTIQRAFSFLWVIALLVGCGGGAGGGAPATVPPPSPPAAQPAPANTVSGTAATGEALSGAAVAATDAAGNALNVSITTAPSGEFSFEIPRNTAYPVVISVTDIDGFVVRTIVGSEPAGENDEIVAHVTPLTEVASASFLDVPDAPPLQQVSAEDFSAAGQEMVSGLFGAAVRFETFSSDPGFVAASPSISQPPSVSDTMLDAIGRAAGQAGQNLMDFVEARSASSAKLMQQPKFQVQLIGELTKKGNPPEELLEKLVSVGANAEDDADATTTLMAAIEGVPKALAAAKEASGKDDDRLDDAVIETLATLAEERVTQGGANAAAETLTNEAVQGAVAEILSEAMEAIISSEADGEEEAEALLEVSQRAGQNAGKVLAGMNDEALASDAGKNAAKNVVKDRAVPQDVEATLQMISDGASIEQLVPDAGEADELKAEVESEVRESISSQPELFGDTDLDGDLIPDAVDAFPLNASESADTDGDGIGDNADGDDDGDGVSDENDAFPLDAAENVDTDGDGLGDNADADDDGDSVPDADDAFPLDGAETIDTDGDGVGDNADTDDDGDGVDDESDAFPLDAAESVDTDGDGVGDNADADDDNDLIPDTEDDERTVSNAITGVALDGYLSGIEIFVDLNWNGAFDEGEPKTLTNDSGAFSIQPKLYPNISESCFVRRPYIALAPAGSVDSTRGALERDLRLVLIPGAVDQNSAVISPFTTVLFDAVQEIVEDRTRASGQSIEGCDAAGDEIYLEVLEKISSIGAQLGQTKALRLFGDYIKEGEGSLEATATEISDVLSAKIALEEIMGEYFKGLYGKKVPVSVSLDSDVAVVLLQNEGNGSFEVDFSVFLDDASGDWKPKANIAVEGLRLNRSGLILPHGCKEEEFCEALSLSVESVISEAGQYLGYTGRQNSKLFRTPFGENLILSHDLREERSNSEAEPPFCSLEHQIKYDERLIPRCSQQGGSECLESISIQYQVQHNYGANYPDFCRENPEFNDTPTFNIQVSEEHQIGEGSTIYSFSAALGGAENVKTIFEELPKDRLSVGEADASLYKSLLVKLITFSRLPEGGELSLDQAALLAPSASIKFETSSRAGNQAPEPRSSLFITKGEFGGFTHDKLNARCEIFADGGELLETLSTDRQPFRDVVVPCLTPFLDVQLFRDFDQDGVSDWLDDSPLIADDDQDGIANRQDVDDDNDGVLDSLDVAPADSGLGRDSDFDGVADHLDAWPEDPLRSADLDLDGLDDSIDQDRDGDGIADFEDSFPDDSDNDGLPNGLDADDDNDGVLDVEDAFPLNPEKRKAIAINLHEAASVTISDQILKEPEAEVSFASSTFERTLKILIPSAYAAAEVARGNTNLTFQSAAGLVLPDAIRASEPTFVAEAVSSPDGRALYLMTSAHIRGALSGLGEEACSVYRFDRADQSMACLLETSVGDIQPRLLISSMEFDFGRRGVDFRSDGAGVAQGFLWRELRGGVSGGTNSTIAWFLTPTGELVPIIPEGDVFVTAALWINDDYFALLEFPYVDDSDTFDPQEDRVSIYSGRTLQKVKEIDVDGAWGRVARWNGSLHFWGGGAGWTISGESLELEESVFGSGAPVVSSTGERALEFLWRGGESVLRSLDGAHLIPLAEKGATDYNWQRQSGTGTDVKYSAFALRDDFVAYIKSLPPEAILEQVNGREVSGEAVSGNGGASYLISQNRFELFVDPAEDVESLEFELSYRGSDDQVFSEVIRIDNAVLDAWRADHPGERPDSQRLEDWGIAIALPYPDRETACIYDFSSKQSNCLDLSSYSVLAFDQESYRSNRYFGVPVYPNNSGNAFPGVSNVLLVDDGFQFFFKDSRDHQYYVVSGAIEDLLSGDEQRLSLDLAVNGAGETTIVAGATSDRPRNPLEVDALTAKVVSAPFSSLTIELEPPPGLNFSAFASLPSILVSKAGVPIPLSQGPTLNETESALAFSLPLAGKGALCDLAIQIQGELWLRDLSTPLKVSAVMLDALDDNCSAEDSEDFVYLVEGSEDNDGDGLLDFVDVDDDNDGLSDADEIQTGSDPLLRDSDGDGLVDGRDPNPMLKNVKSIFGTGRFGDPVFE